MSDAPVQDLEAPFTASELAELLRVKDCVLDHMRERGEGPRYFILRGAPREKGHIRYPREAVRRWLREGWVNAPNDAIAASG